MRTTDEAIAYLTQLGRNAGLDEAGIAKFTSNAAVVKDAQDHLARHDEMASAIDRNKNEAQKQIDAAHARLAEVQKWYDQIAQPTVAQAEKLRAAHDKYKATFGELEEGTVTNGTPKYALKDELNQIGMSTIQVTKQLNRAGLDYLKRFGEVLDPDELERFAVSRGLPPDVAYQQMIAPKVAELDKKASDEREAQHANAVKAAREEGIREGMTRRQWNGEATKTTDQFGRNLESLKQAPDDAERTAGDEFIKAWQGYEEAHAGDLR